mmetsp:Transcript_24165/g.54285  ORF Transcript_24165/g.54285 Transcript_24165/m.54285 type:complete len:232 (-) Transcript_24165:1064-1759(-)
MSLAEGDDNELGNLHGIMTQTLDLLCFFFFGVVDSQNLLPHICNHGVCHIQQSLSFFQINNDLRSVQTFLLRTFHVVCKDRVKPLLQVLQPLPDLLPFSSFSTSSPPRRRLPLVKNPRTPPGLCRILLLSFLLRLALLQAGEQSEESRRGGGDEVHRLRAPVAQCLCEDGPVVSPREEPSPHGPSPQLQARDSCSPLPYLPPSSHCLKLPQEASVPAPLLPPIQRRDRLEE